MTGSPFEFRPYQVEAVPAIRAAVQRSRSVVYQLPTGGGKTVVAAEIARLAAANGKTTFLLVHRRELVSQAIDTLEAACPGLSVGVEAAGWPSQPWAQLQVGMVQSLVRRKFVATPHLVIVDEAHHARAATWARVLERWPKAARVGLTATPQRLDGKGLGAHFKELVSGPSVAELVADGFLAPTLTIRLPEEFLFNLKGIRKNRSGEYRGDDLRSRVTDRTIASAASSYLRYAKGRRAIFFGVDTDHSRRVCERMRSLGVRAEHVDGTDTSARRDLVMNRLRDGGVDVVGNCDLISEGFDAPGCDCVILGAPTASITRYLQCAGRGMRPGPGKVHLFVDLVGASHFLGLPDEDREWSLEDGEIPKPKKKAAQRHCAKCHAVAYVSPCPSCGYAPKKAEIQEVDVELEEAKPNGKPKAKKSRSSRKELYRLIHSARRAKNPRARLEEIADERGYKPGWVAHVMRAYGFD